MTVNPSKLYFANPPFTIDKTVAKLSGQFTATAGPYSEGTYTIENPLSKLALPISQFTINGVLYFEDNYQYTTGVVVTTGVTRDGASIKFRWVNTTGSAQTVRYKTVLLNILPEVDAQLEDGSPTTFATDPDARLDLLPFSTLHNYQKIYKNKTTTVTTLGQTIPHRLGYPPYTRIWTNDPGVPNEISLPVIVSALTISHTDYLGDLTYYLTNDDLVFEAPSASHLVYYRMYFDG